MNTSLQVRFLAHGRLACFTKRVITALEDVRQALAMCARPYIALSAGKDSTVVADLVWQINASVPAVYFDAQCAYPEVSQFFDGVEQTGRQLIRFPCRPFLEVLKEYGLNSDSVEKATMHWTVREPLQRLYREYGFDGVFLGLRTDESRERALMINQNGRLFTRKSDGVVECNPVARWSFDDIWGYLLSRQVAYCKAYDKLFDLELSEESIRLSYWAGETKRRWGRYEALKRGWPELWRKLCDEVPGACSYG